MNFSLHYKPRIILFIIGLLISSKVACQQQPMYSQYMFNMLNINPAYAGNREVANINMLYRNQWAGFPGAPKTGSISYDNRKEGSNSGYGIQLYNDQIGIENTTGLQGFYSLKLPFEQSTLAIGIGFGVLNYRSNLLSTNPVITGDPSLQTSTNGFLPSASFGLLYSREHWYIGLSTPALLKTKINAQNLADVSYNGAENHYYLTGGYSFDVSESIKLKPSVLFKAVSGAPIQADLNMNVWFNNILGVGASCRLSESYLSMLELQITPQFRLGYSYDYNYSKLVTGNRGTHELMLRFELGSKELSNVASPRYF